LKHSEHCTRCTRVPLNGAQRSCLHVVRFVNARRVSWVQKRDLQQFPLEDALSNLTSGHDSHRWHQGRLHISTPPSPRFICSASIPSAHTQRIGTLVWNACVLQHGDVHDLTHRPFKCCARHWQEVCFSGAKARPQAATLMSGGNDNVEHTAAVKALAWDPHIPCMLATGGGIDDMHSAERKEPARYVFVSYPSPDC
jgi:hypothetical protein